PSRELPAKRILDSPDRDAGFHLPRAAHDRGPYRQFAGFSRNQSLRPQRPGLCPSEPSPSRGRSPTPRSSLERARQGLQNPLALALLASLPRAERAPKADEKNCGSLRHYQQAEKLTVAEVTKKFGRSSSEFSHQ